MNLLSLRKQKGLTQKDLASHLGISRQAYANYESGSREPDIATLKQLAEYFDVSLDYLLGQTEKPAENGEPKAKIVDMYNDHEKTLIEAYRNNPDMQGAVDRLLGLASASKENDHVLLYEAAASEDHHRDRYIKKDKEKHIQIKGTPNTDDPLL